VVLASDVDDCAAAMCVPLVTKHRGVETLEGVQRLGKRFKQSKSKRKRGLEGLPLARDASVQSEGNSSLDPGERKRMAGEQAAMSDDEKGATSLESDPGLRRS